MAFQSSDFNLLFSLEIPYVPKITFVNRLRVLFVCVGYYFESSAQINATQIERMDKVVCALLLLSFEKVGFNLLRFCRAPDIIKAFFHKSFRLI